MKSVKKALYSALSGDATLMSKLVEAPYMGRLPSDTAKITTTKAAIVINGEAVRDRPDRESQVYVLDVYSRSHDLVEDVYEEVLRVLGVTVDFRRVWKALTVTPPAAKALIRFESSDDIPDQTSTFFHKAARFRVRAARLIA